MLINENIAYLAGIVDGEGSIGIELLSPTKNRKKNYYVCRLTVINTYKPLMERLVKTFKGQYDERKAIPNRKTCYRWHVFGNDMENALNILLPYLEEKKQQALLILEYRKTVASEKWYITDEILEIRKQLWLDCKKLNNP
jgi:hypothetical protein